MLQPHGLSCGECRPKVESVPAKRVFGHDRSRDLLCANAAPLGAAASLAAPTARCNSTVASAMHPCCSATWDRSIRHSARAGNRTGTLVSNTLVPVPAGNEEHGSTISNSSNDSAAGDDGTGGVDLTAGADVTAKRATITSTSSIRGRRVGDLVRRAAIAGKLASRQWASGVDETSQVVDRGVLVVPESVSRIAKCGLQSARYILGDAEQSQSGNETLILESVERLQAEILHTLNWNIKPI